MVRSALLVLADHRTVSKHDIIEADQFMNDKVKVNKTAYIPPLESKMVLAFGPQSRRDHNACYMGTQNGS